MDIGNQQGDHVAKQKNTQNNPRKIMQTQINEIGGATSSIIGELRAINQHLIGLEALVIHLSDFLGKKEEFEKYIEKKLKEIDRKEKAVKKSENKKSKKIK